MSLTLTDGRGASSLLMGRTVVEPVSPAIAADVAGVRGSDWLGVGGVHVVSSCAPSLASSGVAGVATPSVLEVWSSSADCWLLLCGLAEAVWCARAALAQMTMGARRSCWACGQGGVLYCDCCKQVSRSSMGDRARAAQQQVQLLRWHVRELNMAPPLQVIERLVITSMAA